MPDLCDDRAWLDAFRRGDRDALERVYRAHFETVSNVLRFGFRTALGTKVMGVSDLGLVHDAFVRAFAKDARLGYDGLRPYAPYLLRIVRNTLADHWRKAGREVPWDGSQDDVIAEPADHSELDSDPEWLAKVERTKAFLSTISEADRRFVALRFEQGQSQREVGEALNLTRKQIRLKEDELRAGLTRHLKKSGAKTHGGPQ